MRIIQSSSKSEAINTVATLLLNKIEANPSSVIGLATGRTMEPVYESWTKLVKASTLSLQNCYFFMLDEYFGLPENHPSSFKQYIKNYVLTPLNLSETQFSFPPVHSKDGPKSYEQNINAKGGVDLQLLGIGQNGHIGFNEPGSSKNSRTRRVELTEETIEANKDQFTDGNIPTEALSMGIETILESKSIVMLATGKSKADAIKYLVNHHDDPNCPATYLKGHPHFTLVLDPEAASKINLKI